MSGALVTFPPWSEDIIWGYAKIFTGSIAPFDPARVLPVVVHHPDYQKKKLTTDEEIVFFDYESLVVVWSNGAPYYCSAVPVCPHCQIDVLASPEDTARSKFCIVNRRTDRPLVITGDALWCYNVRCFLRHLEPCVWTSYVWVQPWIPSSSDLGIFCFPLLRLRELLLFICCMVHMMNLQSPVIVRYNW